MLNALGVPQERRMITSPTVPATSTTLVMTVRTISPANPRQRRRTKVKAAKVR